MEVFYRAVWFAPSDSCCRKGDFLFAWRPFSFIRDTRVDLKPWLSSGGTSRRTHVWFALVWSWRANRLGNFSLRSRLHIRNRHLWVIQLSQWLEAGCLSSLACYERLQLVSWPACCHNFLSTKLLLQMWEWSWYHGSRREHEMKFPYLRSCSKKRRASCHKMNTWLFSLIS